MLETLTCELTFRQVVARRSRNNLISQNSLRRPRKMCKNIRHVEFISPAPTSEKCKQIHTDDITIQTQHPVVSNLCVKQPLRVTDAAQRTSCPESKAWKHFLWVNLEQLFHEESSVFTEACMTSNTATFADDIA